MKYTSIEELSNKLTISYPVKYLKITQPFGVNYVGKGFYEAIGLPSDKHNGLDIVASMGTPLYACQDGTIKTYIDRTGGIGIDILGSKTVMILGRKHRLKARYYHCKSFLHSSGTKVRQGQLIGYSGNTGGASTGPHLHFGLKPQYLDGIWKNTFQGNGYLGAVDPKLFFPDNIDLLPVDRRYGETFNWLHEFFMRFKTPGVHRALIRKKRAPLSLANRELNGLVYGGWSIEEILDPVMYQTWTTKTKSFFERG